MAPYESRVDVIVVLGCRVLPSGLPGPALARRAALAAAAFHTGLAPFIVASGGRRWEGRIEARALADELGRLGVPRAAICEELWSLSTLENAVCSAALFRALGRNVLSRAHRVAHVVTCDWHMPRALADFRAAGLEALPLPAVGPPAGRLARGYRWAREAVCGRLDEASPRGPFLPKAVAYACEAVQPAPVSRCSETRPA